MGISTVSGPFRSANGFQQLDENGVWVPVTGGGGGGSNIILIPDNSIPTELPVLDVGEAVSYTIAFNNTTGYSTNYSFAFPTIPGTNAVYLQGGYTNLNFPYNWITIGSPGEQSNPYTLVFNTDGKLYFTFVYLGIKPTGFIAPSAYWLVFGWAGQG